MPTIDASVELAVARQVESVLQVPDPRLAHFFGIGFYGMLTNDVCSHL
jgi:hypothetical protein